MSATENSDRKMSLLPQIKEDGRRPSMITKSLNSPQIEPRRISNVGMTTRARSISYQHPTPSFFGVLASKRLAKRFASRFYNRRYGGFRPSGETVIPQKEPTYRMEPYRKFNPEMVQEMLKTLLETKLSQTMYSPRVCADLCKFLADDIKERVKHMNFDRYKIVSDVTIGQNNDQAIITCSRCAWDEKLDNYASYTFQNEHIFCTATVFGVYNE